MRERDEYSEGSIFSPGRLMAVDAGGPKDEAAKSGCFDAESVCWQATRLPAKIAATSITHNAILPERFLLAFNRLEKRRFNVFLLAENRVEKIVFRRVTPVRRT